MSRKEKAIQAVQNDRKATAKNEKCNLDSSGFEKRYCLG